MSERRKICDGGSGGGGLSLAFVFVVADMVVVAGPGRLGSAATSVTSLSSLSLFRLVFSGASVAPSSELEDPSLRLLTVEEDDMPQSPNRACARAWRERPNIPSLASRGSPTVGVSSSTVGPGREDGAKPPNERQYQRRTARCVADTWSH
ncbi:hypothetical protein NUW58_g1988 [Xylaria curta]|uniref:Uncharacterized protein n=1 Tax=Xylaria curta TaxID=42375 RepID=A0ACC1PJI6_9PEZI|nr:hypothetical protein NUW58_g1988 [Xylaria curta]